MSYIVIHKISRLLCVIENVAYNTLPCCLSILEKAHFSLNIDDNQKIENWTPCADLVHHRTSKYAVIILNTPINVCLNERLVINLWNRAKARVTVNGGADKWFQWLRINKRECDEILNPDIITGDMDSISKDVLNYFQARGAKVIMTPDQDETDYTKALREFKIYCSTHNIDIDIIYVLVNISGRFDHIMGNINTLFQSKYIFESVKIIQMASKSLTWLISKGHHSINIPTNLRKDQVWCSLIPIGAPCIVTSTGLKWNLQNTKLAFGSLISTSNTYNGSPIVTILTDGPVLWSMGITTLES